MSQDYKATIFLPQTSFPMKGDLPQKEPEILKWWDDIKIYDRLHKKAEGRERFVIHDGPPYANGRIHLGHALNHILKDIINKSQYKLGKSTPFIPGWDCHGLPIEAKVEEQYREKGVKKEDVDPIQFREECRAFAEHWIQVQIEDFKRLGMFADWEHPYTTMSPQAEAEIIRLLGIFVMNKGLYRGIKPVMWSVVEKTALAEAEVEYYDHESLSIYVRFPITKSSIPGIEGASAVIWTTTPWTLPGNRAIAYGADLDYVALRVDEVTPESQAVPGEVMVIAKGLQPAVEQKLGIERSAVLETFKGEKLKDTEARHPFFGEGYDFGVPLLPGEHVTLEAGTGLVHTAPGHGVEDFAVGKEFGLEVPETVNEEGLYYDHVPLFAGKHVYKVGPEVVQKLQDRGALLWEGKIVHSYPHSWRSKKPLIYRTTPQWFLSLDENNLREEALAAIDKVTWIPKSSKNRIQSMVENRPDWCLSRQREWGTPMTLFVHKATGKVLRDHEVMARIVEAVREEGSNVWYRADSARFLGPNYKPDDYEKVQDILDVWFDSGCTQSFVLRLNPALKWPADLYVEGSDQHRGWFQSSLLVACGAHHGAPYRQVITHGFIVDEDGRKMSKSRGDAVSPQTVTSTMGADILRLWVVGSDIYEDLKVGPEILKRQQDIYRRYRNTFRYLLGALAGFSDEEKIDYVEMPDLEKWVLHRLYELDQRVREATNNYDFQALYADLHTFCAVDLSAFYFDVRKDALYCDGQNSLKRRATRTVMDVVFDCLAKWLAPVLAFTAEEAWLNRHPRQEGSVHEELFPLLPYFWNVPEVALKFDTLRDLRRVITGALEVARASKEIGSSLQAQVTLFIPSSFKESLKGIDLAELSIASGVECVEKEVPQDAFTLEDVPGVGAVVSLASGNKCSRCWKVLPEVQDLCCRCREVVAAYE